MKSGRTYGESNCYGRVFQIIFATATYIKKYEAAVGEALVCEREPKNTSDRYTVAVKKEGTFALKTVAGVFAVLQQGDTQSQV